MRKFKKEFDFWNEEIISLSGGSIVCGSTGRTTLKRCRRN